MATEKSPNVPPFVRFCSASVPMVFDNSLSYYECLCALTKFIQDLVNTVNYNATQLDGLQEAFKELKAYVDNYFDNLDVQAEINAKLDEMAEGGQLATIIAQFLAAAPVFAYGTIAEMAAATNLNNGCIARVLGNSSAAAGDGAYYMIRTRIESDDPDGVNLVAIGDTLVGVRVQDAAVNDLQEQVNELKTPSKKYLFVGDSYATGYQGEGQATLTGYFTRVKTTLGLDATILAANGYGFLGMSNVNKWQTLIENASLADKDSYTDIIIAGGMNDQIANLGSQMDTTIAYLKANFTNATIHIAMIGKYKAGTTSDIARIRGVYEVYKDGAARNNCKFIENAEYILHNVGFFINDNIHPNESGQAALAKYFTEYIANGSISVFYPNEGVTITNGSNISSNFSMYTSLENNIVRVYITGRVEFTTDIATLSNLDTITLGTLTSSYLCASENNQGLNIQCQGYAWSEADNKPHAITLHIKNDESNNLIAKVILIDASNTYSLSQVNEINIVSGDVSDTVPSIYC